MSTPLIDSVTPASMPASPGWLTNRARLVVTEAFSQTESCVIYGIQDTTGQIDVFVESTAKPSPFLSRRLQLDVIDTAYEVTRRAGLDIHVTNPFLAKNLRHNRSGFPLARFHARCPAELGDLLRQTMAVRTETLRRLQKDTRQIIESFESAEGTMRIVGTDASMSTCTVGAGIAYIDDRGNSCARFLADVEDIFCAELAAIALAVESHDDERLLVLNDNQGAVIRATAAVAGHNPNDEGPAPSILRRIATAAAGRDVRIVWVPGHRGLPLNEHADELAVAARKHHDRVRLDDLRRLPADVLRATV